jgi:hypothetical protein
MTNNNLFNLLDEHIFIALFNQTDVYGVLQASKTRAVVSEVLNAARDEGIIRSKHMMRKAADYCVRFTIAYMKEQVIPMQFSN